MTGIVIARAPLRISLGGGGTDLKSYYEKEEGFWISGAINKYIYVTLHKTFSEGYIIKYSVMEKTERVTEIRNDIVRETFKLHDVKNNIEMSSVANIPSGTGLGSSGTFGVALLEALNALNGEPSIPVQLAEESSKIQMDILKRPIGFQDQYIAALGGITCFSVDKKGNVTCTPLRISRETLNKLEQNLLLFFTGFSRKADSILKEQDDKSKKSDEDMINNLNFVKKLGFQSKEALEQGDLQRFGEILNTHWAYKKKRSGNMTNEQTDKWYQTAVNNGAIGGKIIGAGGGGFLMFYTEEPKRLRKAMREEGLEEIEFKFDFEGSRIVVNELAN